jgi:hypothetical protein
MGSSISFPKAHTPRSANVLGLGAVCPTFRPGRATGTGANAARFIGSHRPAAPLDAGRGRLSWRPRFCQAASFPECPDTFRYWPHLTPVAPFGIWQWALLPYHRGHHLPGTREGRFWMRALITAFMLTAFATSASAVDCKVVCKFDRSTVHFCFRSVTDSGCAEAASKRTDKKNNVICTHQIVATCRPLRLTASFF